MKTTHSVSTRIAHYLYLIIIFAGIITTLSLGIMRSNKSDAELINISGSLRMQTYRLLHTMQYEPSKIELGLRQYRLSLHSTPILNAKEQLFAPEALKRHYQDLVKRWQDMETFARQGNQVAYRAEVESYVTQLDNFVFSLQHFAERKLSIVALIIGISMLLIVAMVSYVIWYTRKKVVNPLHQLEQASMQVQMRQFNHIPLDVNNKNELGTLAQAFTQMASELKKLYTNLEEKVKENTQKLNQTNRTLSMLYHCSQQLSTTHINQEKLQSVLQQIATSEHLRAVELSIDELWDIRVGTPNHHLPWQQQAIEMDKNQLGTLRWQAGLPCPDPRSMSNIAKLLGRTLYIHQTQRQQQQLLLMEERAIIARELHDSLAQVLSFLQIQLTLLKHTLNKQDEQAKAQSLTIIQQFEQALSGGYRQLRELLATFRLTVQDANLQVALEQVLDSLRNQTSMQLNLSCQLPSQSLTAQQLVHALQIVREAVLNAIKHSQGTQIDVVAHCNQEGKYEFIIRDNGIGIPSLDEPAGHYGLNIMHERCQQLNGTLQIAKHANGGTEVKVILAN